VDEEANELRQIDRTEAEVMETGVEDNRAADDDDGYGDPSPADKNFGDIGFGGFLHLAEPVAIAVIEADGGISFGAEGWMEGDGGGGGVTDEDIMEIG